jgi:hypothetical protein
MIFLTFKAKILGLKFSDFSENFSDLRILVDRTKPRSIFKFITAILRKNSSNQTSTKNCFKKYFSFSLILPLHSKSCRSWSYCPVWRQVSVMLFIKVNNVSFINTILSELSEHSYLGKKHFTIEQDCYQVTTLFPHLHPQHVH